MNKQELEEAIQVAYSAGKTKEVKTLSEQAVTNYPEEAFGYAYLAKAALLEKPIAFDNAELNWTKASEIEPSNTLYLCQFAEVKTRLGKHDDAQLLWTKVIDIESNHLTALTTRGRYLLENKSDYPQAIEVFNQSIQYHADHAQSYFYRAIAHTELKQYEKALEDYTNFVKLNNGEESAETLLAKLRILNGLNYTEERIATHQKLSELVPDNQFYPLSAAQLLEELKRYQEAAEYYAKTINLIDKTNSQYSSIAFSWGNTLYESKQYEKAIEAFDLHAQHSDSPIYSYQKQIDIYQKIKQDEKALEKLDIIRKINTDTFETHKLNKLKADILLRLRRYHEAVDILYLLVEVDNIYRNEAAFLIGRTLFMAKEMPHAYHYLRLASISGEEKATNFLNENFKDYIFSLQSTFYKKHQATAKSNAKSGFLKKINGKVWRFNRLKDPNSDIPEEVDLMNEIASEMPEAVILYLTEVGFLLGIPESVDFYAFSIKESNAKQMIIDTQSIDGLLTGETTICLTEDGLLDYSITGNEKKAMLLEEISVEEINEPIKIRLKQAAESRHIELLGKNAKELTKAIWS